METHAIMKDVKDILKLDREIVLNEKGIGDFKYVDNDVMLIDNIQHITRRMPAIRLDMLLVVFCKQGRIQLNINGHTHMAYPDNIIIVNGMQILTEAMFSSDFSCEILTMSNRRFDEIIHSDHKAMDAFLYVNDNPVLVLSPDEQAVAEIYKDIFERKFHMPRHEYFSKTINGILTAAIYDFIGIILRQRANKPAPEATTFSTSEQAQATVRKFLLLLVEDASEHHSVEYFAQQLYITPKYLSYICKRQTGKTPSQWIRDQLVEKVRSMLLTTNLSGKEIAQRLNFPNPSFFGKFVKQNLGTSPIKFRKKHK